MQSLHLVLTLKSVPFTLGYSMFSQLVSFFVQTSSSDFERQADSFARPRRWICDLSAKRRVLRPTTFLSSGPSTLGRISRPRIWLPLDSLVECLVDGFLLWRTAAAEKLEWELDHQSLGSNRFDWVCLEYHVRTVVYRNGESESSPHFSPR